MTDYVKSIRAHVGHACIMLCGASVIVENADGEILLQLRSDNGCWGYAGGGVEIDESTEDTARRELFEETGLTALELKLYGVFSGKDHHYVYPNGDEVSIVDVVYVCDKYTGALRTDGNETADLRFFKPSELPDNLSPPIAQTLRDYAEMRVKGASGE